MLAKRIIPCLDVRNGMVVKGKNFTGIVDVASPSDLAAKYNAQGADELVFYDITATHENRALFGEVLEKVAREVFIPLTVGGGINTLDDFERVLNLGADKVSVNSGAIKDPSIIENAAKKYGSQCVVLSIDVKSVGGVFKVFSHGARVETELDAVEWAKRGVNSGAGELVINSIDTDGVKKGFDLKMLEAISSAVNIPIIASGGAGCIEDFVSLFQNPSIDAGLAASIFHYGQVNIKDLKSELSARGINVRKV